ncbi:MAG TPA: hypothetical protein VIL01_15900 [Thermomicrobiales bacterium]
MSLGVPRAVIAGIIFIIVAGLVATVVPIDVRHSAPYGFSLTADFDRGIAVTGGYVRPNYDGFNRLDLDLRAYTPETVYDLVIHIRPADPGAEDLRVIPLRVASERVFHRKAAFENPFITVRFPAIEDSAGKSFYVWVERGPRNRDAVIALWSIKSYSRLDGLTALRAFVRGEVKDSGVPGLALILLLVAIVLVAGWTTGALLGVGTRWQSGQRPTWRHNRWQGQESDGIQ